MKLSVALCTYNGSLFIETQINSIINQSIAIDEIIICDDQSTDTTVEILKKIQAQNPSIIIIENEKNLKSTKNFEKAIALCTGDYIFLADQDDVWNKQKVEKTLAVFKDNPSAEGVFSNANLINKNNTVFTTKTIWDSVFFFEKELEKPIDYYDLISKNGNVVTGATLCVKKEIKSFIFPFPEKRVHDEWIASLLGFRKTLFYSTENLISYRVHYKQQVGMKNLTKINLKSHKKRIILGLETPKKFSEYRTLQKKAYRKQNALLEFKNHNIDFISFETLQNQSIRELEELNYIIKKKFPIQYKITNLVDKIRGKRKIM